MTLVSRFIPQSLVTLALAASVGATEVAEVELASGASRASDGFHFELTAGPTDHKTKRGIPYRLIWCTFQVPERVAETQFVEAGLEVSDSRGRPLSYASISSSDGDLGMRVLAVHLEPRFAARCSLLVRYGVPPHGSLVTEYRVPLKEHVQRHR